MVEVFTKCKSCGIDMIYLKRAKAIYPDLVVHATKYDKEQRERHAEYLKSIGITGSYEGIVVSDGEVKLLKEVK